MFLQPLNISCILTTLLVLKFDKSNETKFSQFLNIPFIVVTLEVSKFDKFNDFKLLHPENIFSIFST